MAIRTSWELTLQACCRLRYTPEERRRCKEARCGTVRSQQEEQLTLHVALVVMFLQQAAEADQLFVFVGRGQQIGPGRQAAAVLGQRPDGEGGHLNSEERGS